MPYTSEQFKVAYNYVYDAPYLSPTSINILMDDHTTDIIHGIAGLMYNAEISGSFRCSEIKTMLTSLIDISAKRAEELMYYADSFPHHATFVKIYFDQVDISPNPSPEQPHILRYRCPYRSCPIDRAEEIAELMLKSGIHQTYLIPDLCQKDIILDETYY